MTLSRCVELRSPLQCIADSLVPPQFFNNEKFEVAQYDKAMKDYTKASVKISTSLAALNIGQNAIFSTALTGMMYLAAKGIYDGELCSCDQFAKLMSDLRCRHDDGR